MADFNINTAGFAIVGLFVVTWVVALAVWRFAKIESRWDLVAPTTSSARRRQQAWPRLAETRST